VENALDCLAIRSGDLSKTMGFIVLEKSLNVRIIAYLHLFVPTQFPDTSFQTFDI
jgi:hypothetical protein